MSRDFPINMGVSGFCSLSYRPRPAVDYFSSDGRKSVPEAALRWPITENVAKNDANCHEKRPI
jgi:hypothetical protein